MLFACIKKIMFPCFAPPNSSDEECSGFRLVDETTKWEDTEVFTFPAGNYRVIKCYDGDTITVAFRTPGDDQIYRQGVRLDGIDCPELHPKQGNSSDKQLESERECAQLAQKFVADLILGKVVCLSNIKHEKYGRALATVSIDGINLNKMLVANRLAVAYDGGTKICPSDWMKYYCTGYV